MQPRKAQKPRPYKTAWRAPGVMSREHVLVVEKALERRLPRGVEVHHVDGDGWNNRNSNLVVLQNRGEHTSLHARLRVLRAGGHPFNDAFCYGCQRVKPRREFYIRKSGRRQGSVTNACKACSRSLAMVAHYAHHDARKAQMRAYQACRRAEESHADA